MWSVWDQGFLITLTIWQHEATFTVFLDRATGLDFTNIFTWSFYARSSQKRKNSVKSSVSFYAFGIYRRKSNVERWWNWHLVFSIHVRFYMF